MVGESGGVLGEGGAKIGVMMWDRDSWSEERVVVQGERKEKTINTRRPSIRGRRIVSDVKERVSVMRRVEELEVRFEGGPRAKEVLRWDVRGSRGRVFGTLDEVEVAAKEGGDVVGSSEHGLDEKFIEVVVTRSEIDVEKLKGRVRRRGRSIAAQLGEALGDRREGDVGAVVVLGEEGSVENGRATLKDILVISGDAAILKVRQSKLFFAS